MEEAGILMNLHSGEGWNPAVQAQFQVILDLGVRRSDGLWGPSC